MRYRRVTRVVKSREDLIDEIVAKWMADMTPKDIRLALEDRLYAEADGMSDAAFDAEVRDLEIDLYHEPQEWED